MPTLMFLIWVNSAALALNILGFFSARATAYLAQRDRTARDSPPSPSQDGSLPAAAAVTLAVDVATGSAAASDETPGVTVGHWLRQFLTPLAVLGVLVAPLQCFIVLVNSAILRETLEVILGRSGVPLLQLMTLGWDRELTDLDAIGGLISIAQMITVSAGYLAWQARPRCWPIVVLALTAFGSLVSYEVGASFYRALILESGLWNALLSGGLALGIAATEGCVGILADYCVLPLLLALFTLLTVPWRGVRALARWWRARQRGRPGRSRARHDGRPHPLVLGLVYSFSAIDQALVPLRSVDFAIAGCIAKRFPGTPSHHQEGEQIYDTALVPTQTASRSVLSRNGHDPRGV